MPWGAAWLAATWIREAPRRAAPANADREEARGVQREVMEACMVSWCAVSTQNDHL